MGGYRSFRGGHCRRQRGRGDGAVQFGVGFQQAVVPGGEARVHFNLPFRVSPGIPFDVFAAVFAGGRRGAGGFGLGAGFGVTVGVAFGPGRVYAGLDGFSARACSWAAFSARSFRLASSSARSLALIIEYITITGYCLLRPTGRSSVFSRVVCYFRVIPTPAGIWNRRRDDGYFDDTS